jgi:glutamate-5-semialdehyde dehydrogenase
MTSDPLSPQLLGAVQRANKAVQSLEILSGKERSQGVQAMAEGIQRGFDKILEANTLDLEMSREMAVSDIFLDWLKLTPERLQATVNLLLGLADLPDPLHRLMYAPYQHLSSQTYCQLMPLGVIALIYEGFPEIGAITAGFCLKTGNSLILRGCSASFHTTKAIAEILQEALDDNVLPQGCIELLPADGEISVEDIVTQAQSISLVIPYGRTSLIDQVTQLATAPVLRTAIGNCYLYWSPNGDWELVKSIIIDSHATVPDPVNAIEKVLVSTQHNTSLLVRLFNGLKEKGFQLRGDANLITEFSEYLAPLKESEWTTPYLDKIVAFKYVDNLSAGVRWMNNYSSGHADCLVTESYRESRQFAKEINSALVFINASPRFSRKSKQGDAHYLGISNQKGLRRGLIGLESLTTLKHVVLGEGKFM